MIFGLAFSRFVLYYHIEVLADNLQNVFAVSFLITLFKETPIRF